MTAELIVPIVAFLLAAVCLGFSIRAGRRHRLVQNIPTSKTTGVFIGLVELKGTAEAERPLRSFLTELPCVYYRWSIAEHWSKTETYRDKDGKTRTRRKSGWSTIASDTQHTVFYLKDDEGVIRVRPDEAEIDAANVLHRTCGRSDPLYYGKGPRRSIMNSTHRRRFVEEAIRLHAPLYIMGPARERDDVVAPEIRHASDAAMYLISVKTEERVARGYRWQYWGLGVFAILLAVAGWVIRHHLIGLPWQTHVGEYVGFAAGTISVWLLGSVWMIYNSLVDFRQRVRQAWSNVDVQLRRRHDLIPRLVNVVEGLRDHERQLQTELAALRAQMNATAPGERGPDPHGCAPALLLIAERYPELKSDEAFLNLQQTLVDTEQRIALARAYFNEIATHYNTRLEIVPDRLFARFAGLRPRPLITAADFERAPVEVRLAEDADAPPTTGPLDLELDEDAPSDDATEA